MAVAALKRRHWQPPCGLEDVHNVGQSWSMGLLKNMRTVKWWASQWLCQLRPLSGQTLQDPALYSAWKQGYMPSLLSLKALIGVLLISSLLGNSEAASTTFENCLSPNIIEASPPQPLQWVPLYVLVVFNLSDPSHNLNVTVYGNVTGQTTVQELPPPNSTDWSNSSVTLGKLPDRDPANNKFSTLRAAINVLTYTPYRAAPSRFCNSTLNTHCPIAPVFLSTENM